MSEQETAELYHLTLMADEGLVLEEFDGLWRLTTLGHDAVEAIGENSIWEKLKKASPSEAYEIVKGVGTSVAVVALSKVMGWG